MDKLLVTLFKDEGSAFDGLDALRDLHSRGDITLYSTAVMAKSADGSVKTLQAEDEGPVGGAVGLLAGSLFGLIGGPVGVAVGATVGVTTGALYDVMKLGIGSDFIDDVSSAIEPGTVAVVADIDEAWMTPVEVRMTALGGRTFRQVPSDVVDDQVNRDIDAMSAELAQLGSEMADASAEDVKAIVNRVETDAAKIEQLKKRADAAVEKAKADYESRLATLRAQREHAVEQRKAAIDSRITELKASFEARKAKLQRAHELSKQAGQLRREALSPTH